MERQDIDYFRSLLTNQLEELLRQATDSSDRSGPETDRDFMRRIRDREHTLILRIREALDRIEGSAFGFCEKCGGEISLERLRMRPLSVQCIDCQTPDSVA